jgi:Holliday junction resolvase-like predicted endonuclease
MTDKLELGRRAEGLAADYLRGLGLVIRGQNVRLTQGELDIVAHDGQTWIFVEVRSRSQYDPVTALDSIGPQKRRQVRRMIRAYLAFIGLDDWNGYSRRCHRRHVRRWRRPHRAHPGRFLRPQIAH